MNWFYSNEKKYTKVFLSISKNIKSGIQTKKEDKSISLTGVSLIVFFSVRDQNIQCAALRAFGSLSATDRSTFSKFIFLVTSSLTGSVFTKNDSFDAMQFFGDLTAPRVCGQRRLVFYGKIGKLTYSQLLVILIRENSENIVWRSFYWRAINLQDILTLEII